MLRIIAPFKSHKIGDLVDVDPITAEWLISRRYAERVADVPPPLQDEPPKKPLTTRKKKIGELLRAAFVRH